MKFYKGFTIDTALGYELDYVWNEEDRVAFLFNWYVFEQAFHEAFDGSLRITPADAFLILLEEHPYEKLREMPPLVLVHLLRSAWSRLYALHKDQDTQTDVPTANTTMLNSDA